MSQTKDENIWTQNAGKNAGQRLGDWNKLKTRCQWRAQKNDGHSNIVGDIMWPVILFLKLSGHFPLVYDRPIKKSESPGIAFRNSDGIKSQAKEYKLRIKSLFLLWTAGYALWILYLNIIYIHEVLCSENGFMGSLETIQENRIKSGVAPGSLVIISKVLRVCVVIMQILELLLAWQESFSLATFLNHCEHIQNELHLTFSFKHPWKLRYKKLIKTRDILLLFYLAIPSLVCVPFYIYGFWKKPYIYNFIASFTLGFQSVPATLMEDVKVLMTYLVLANEFNQIREGIIMESANYEGVTKTQVKAWTRIVNLMRLQVEHAGQSQKYHQLVVLGGSVVTITGFTFIFLNSPWSDRRTWLGGVLGISYTLYIVGRLYLKILAATEITGEERKIAKELVIVQTKINDDTCLQQEIKFLYDMIIQNPSVISFGDYINLNKSLLLGVGSQVVTYIIVLMQFNSS